MLENMVLRRIFGPMRDKGIGEWRKLRNEELNDLYTSSNIVWAIKSRRMRSAEHVASMGRVLVGKPKGKRPLGRPRRRWQSNIQMDVWEVGCEETGWIDFAQDKDGWWTLVNAVMSIRVQ
jgi:hypothetical protein